MTLNDEQLLALWLGATRYYLGRRSYAVSIFCGLLIAQWGSLPERTQNLIQRDIEEEFRQLERYRAGELSFNPLGMDMDVRQWEQVRELWS
jgi:hypothetical protein